MNKKIRAAQRAEDALHAGWWATGWEEAGWWPFTRDNDDRGAQPLATFFAGRVGLIAARSLELSGGTRMSGEPIMQPMDKAQSPYEQSELQ